MLINLSDSIGYIYIAFGVYIGYLGRAAMAAAAAATVGARRGKQKGQLILVEQELQRLREAILTSITST